MKLNPIFTDNAVLQANKPISIFGNGRGSATLKIAGATFEISSERELVYRASRDGLWWTVYA